MKKLIVLFLTVLLLGGAQGQESGSMEGKDIEELMNLSLEELLDIDVVSASNKKEKLSDAPATIVVIENQEMKKRGYTDLVEVLNDLPAIDLSVTYGDLYYKAYWRGYRKGMPSPFLLMVDGMVMNQLYYNWTDVLSAIPLSNVKQVEVVYGPASSVYGPNALMGVINIITEKDLENDGYETKISIGGGSFDTKVVDFNTIWKSGDFRLSFTGMINQRDLDENSLENYEWTKKKYLEDRGLWGNFIDNENILDAKSPQRNKSFTAQMFFKNTELGFQYYRVYTGWGLNYAFDKTPPNDVWVEPDMSLYLKHNRNYSDRLQSQTLIRYRNSDLSNESSSLENWGGNGAEPLLAYGFWQSLNRSWLLEHNFDLKVSEDLSFKTGIKYEEKDLQKNYDLAYGEAIPVSEVDVTTYPFPEAPVHAYQPGNRITWKDQGVYLQGKYRVSSIMNSNYDQFINLGFRVDDNSEYGTNHTIRAGYVGSFSSLLVKLLYGESYQEPVPRQLYGSWSGAGNAPDLKPEESKTIEMYLQFTKKNLSFALNPYYVTIEKSINDVNGVPTNLGDREAMGVDLHSQAFFNLNGNSRLSFWGYYSFINTSEEKYDSEGNKLDDDPVGDIADHKIHFGLTFELKNRYYITLRNRWISEKDTYENNPIETVDAYFTSDLNILWKQFLADHVDLNFKVTNILDTEYYHSGIRDANAGDTPGTWRDNKWYGSGGWYNSLLPQPGMGFYVALTFNL